nr:MAG TPA: hypothetical protein [Caudoviricetes sp.]
MTFFALHNKLKLCVLSVLKPYSKRHQMEILSEIRR